MPLFSPEERKFLNREIEKELGLVVATFTIQQVPAGAAPETIRRDWVGATLPVRQALLDDLSGRQQYYDLLSGERKTNPDAVPVYGMDAVNALDDMGRDRAARFWQNYAVATLVFSGSEGNLEITDLE